MVKATLLITSVTFTYGPNSTPCFSAETDSVSLALFKLITVGVIVSCSNPLIYAFPGLNSADIFVETPIL